MHTGCYDVDGHMHVSTRLSDIFAWFSVVSVIDAGCLMMVVQ